MTAATGPEAPTPSRARERVAALIVAAMLTLLVQVLLGHFTLYQPDYEQPRMIAHRAVIANEPPSDAGWKAHGLNSENIRIVVPYAAEGIARVTGTSVLAAYQLIDVLALFVALLLLWRFLRHWFPPGWTFVGLLLTGYMLTLTMGGHYYHPSDRASLAAWIALLMAIRDDRPWRLAGLLLVAVPIKFDVVVAPGLYFLTNVRRDTRLRHAAITAGLLVLAVGLLFTLVTLFPGGSEPRVVANTIKGNVTRLLNLGRPHPVLFGIGPLVVFGIPGWRGADRYMRTAALFGFALLAVFFVATNFQELRAMVMVCVMLLPLALRGVVRHMDRRT